MAGTERPNVILVVTDDQGYGDMACHGNPVLKTPNLDTLHGQSTRLENHHQDPLCSPSRAALITGRYASRGGVWHVIQGRQLLDRSETTMAEVFSANGYRTAMFGKWHLGDSYPYAPGDRGFEEVVKHNGGGVGEIPDAWGNDYFDDVYVHNGKAEGYAGYCTDVFFGEALGFIESNRDRPFFVYLATNAMHSPFIVADEYADPYLAQGIPDDRARFYGMIANFDENMGRLFDKLEALGLEENTIVIFTADHGTAAGYDPETGNGYNAGMRGKKGDVYDGGHHVGCFIRWPGQLPAGHGVKHLTAHLDLLPTLVDLCKLKQPHGPEPDGISLVPSLLGEPPEPPRRTLFTHLQPDQPVKWHHCAVLTDRWRLVNGAELYDVLVDPGQEKEIAEEHPDVVAELRRAYEGWWDDVSPAFARYCPFILGAPEEDPTVLTSREWHPTEGSVPWMQESLGDDSLRGNGFWAVDVTEAGTYEIALRRYPLEADLPMRAATARLKIGDTDVTEDVAEEAVAASFRLNLPAGPAFLQTWLTDASGPSRGASYVYVRRTA